MRLPGIGGFCRHTASRTFHISMSALTDKEVEQYDRQIRLWGVDAQRRMRDALVMVAGMDALGTEVVKNLVLAGVSVILADGETVERARLGAAYFLNESHIGQNVS